MRRLAALVALVLPALLAGCDMLGIESAAAVAARREAEGKAIGAGCRHSGRPIEECYGMNKRAEKASVFAGWKEMNDYMRENHMESAPPAAESEPADKPAAERKAAAPDEARAAAKSEVAHR